MLLLHQLQNSNGNVLTNAGGKGVKKHTCLNSGNTFPRCCMLPMASEGTSANHHAGLNRSSICAAITVVTSHRQPGMSHAVN